MKNISLTEKCANEIRRQLLCGVIGSKTRLINEKSLRKELDVSRITMRRALSILQVENLLISIPYRGYVPGPAAHIITSEKAFKSGSCRTVLWIRPPANLHKELMHEKMTLSAAVSEAERAGLTVNICQLQPNELVPYIESIRDTIYGIALDWLDPSIAEMVRITGLPATLVEGSIVSVGIDCVIQANERGTELAIEKLWNEGHRRIGLVVWAIPATQPVRRRSAFVTSLLQRKIIDMGLVGSTARFDNSGGKEAVARIFNRPNPPTALIICHPEMASGVLDELESRSIVPGKDIALVVWGLPDAKKNWIGSEKRMSIPIDTITWSREEMGRLVIRTLQARRSDPTMPPLHVEVPVRLTRA